MGETYARIPPHRSSNVSAMHAPSIFPSSTKANSHKGLSEAQNGYGFGMLPGHGPRDGLVSSLALDGSPACKLTT